MTKKLNDETGMIDDVTVLFTFVQAIPHEMPAIFVCTKEYLDENEETDDDIMPHQFSDILVPVHEEDPHGFYYIQGSERFRLYDQGYGCWTISELKDGMYDDEGEVDEKELMYLLGQIGFVKDDALLAYF